MRIRPVAVVKSPLPVHMRHQAPKPPTRLRELLSGRERLQARGGADCEDLPHDVCGHDSVEGYVQPMLPAGGSSRLLGELRPWPRRVAASVVCAACILVALWLVVGLQLADAPIITPEVRRALSIMWVEGLEGGLSGAAAMVVQVLTLLWLRTTMNFQYKHGGSFCAALSYLYKEGGVGRLYAGLLPALIQGPLSRFGDTAANDGVQAALASMEATKGWHATYVTLVCSLVAGAFRVLLMPIEVIKTSMQVQGAGALGNLRNRISRRGACVLWEGLLATYCAHFSGHFPWFATRNALMAILPSAQTPQLEMLRAGVIGLTSSLVADLVSNPLRVIKTCKQTSEDSLTYAAAVRLVCAQAGVHGLLFRGIGTKMCCNALQSIMFSILWSRFHSFITGADSTAKS